MTAESHCGVAAFTVDARGGGSVMCFPTISCEDSPSNGGLPVTIW
jgi:hypothetical protein